MPQGLFGKSVIIYLNFVPLTQHGLFEGVKTGLTHCPTSYVNSCWEEINLDLD